MLYTGLLILIFITILLGLGILFIFFPKIAKYLLITCSLILLTIAFLIAFEDELFSRNDAKELLEEHGIELVGEFKLTHNESKSWFGQGRFHTFTLQISSTDKSRIISTIKKSNNYHKVNESISNMHSNTENKNNGTIKIENYETADSFIRDYIDSKNNTISPKYRRIKVYKKKEELVFLDIDY